MRRGNINAKRRRRGSDERRTWIEKLDKVFSLYVRLRDSRRYGFRYFRCISCGEIKPFDQMDAGHYISRNCMALRYSPQNVWGECKACNRFCGDHLIGYRKNLIIRLGEEAVRKNVIASCLPDDRKMLVIRRLGTKMVEELEAMKHQTRKWSVGELKAMYIHFAEKVLEMKGGM